VTNETAKKLLQLYLDQKIAGWMTELGGIAAKIGLSPEELLNEVKPLLQEAFEKNLKQV